MKRRWRSILAVLALVLCLLPITAAAAGSGTAEDPWFCGQSGKESAVQAVLSDGTLTIRGTGGMMIPYNDSASGYPWYDAREDITKLVVESGVTSIGPYAFQGFASLTEVSLPDGLDVISDNAFQDAGKLERVTIPSSVSQVSQLAFNGCAALSEVTFLRRTPPIISFNAFYNCDKLQTINVPCGTGEAYKAREYLPAGAIREAAHTPDGNGTCTGCGLRILAIVQGNGNTYYTDIREAFAAANAAGWNPDIILEDNVTLLEGESLTVEEGKSLTLICDGFTLSGSSEQVIDVYGSLNFIGGTLKNIANSGGVVNVHPGGMFTMYSEGTLEPTGSDGFAVTALGDADSKAIVTISGGSVGVGAGGLNVGANTYVTLYGGTYGKIVAGGPSDPDTTVSGLFFPGSGCAFFKDGKPVVLEPGQHTLEGPVTVGKCTHIWGNFVQTEGETHSSTCLACGKTEEAVDCAYGDWTDAGDGATHKDVCVCGREKTEEHRWEYSAGQTGKVSTISRTCGSCGRSETVGTLTISEDFHVPFGQTAGRKVEVTCDPETLELNSIRWYIDVVEALAAKGLTCNLSGKKVSTETYKFTASCHGCAIELTADVTVEPAPLPEDKIQVDLSPVTFANKAFTPEVTIDGLTPGTDYTVEYQDNISAGTASIVIAGKGNYTGTVTKTFEIKKAELTFAGTLTAAELTYGTPLSEAEVSSPGAIQLDGAGVTGSWKIESTDTPDVGEHTYTAVFVPTDRTVAVNCEPLTCDVTVTVTKAHFETQVDIQSQAGKTLEYDLAAGLSSGSYPPLPEGLLSGTEWSAEYQEVLDEFSILDGDPAVAGGKLTVRTLSTASAGEGARVGVQLNSKNWDIDLTCRIGVVDKLVPSVNNFVLEHTYDGQAPDLAEAVSQMTAVCNGEPVPGTFTVEDPEAAPVHVRDTKMMSVVFTPEDTGTYKTVRRVALGVRILPAKITVRVRDQAVTQNGAMPELAYTVEGLGPGERLKTEPTLTCEAQDTATVGTYAITAAGAEVPDGGDYEAEIAYMDGTLTIKAPTPPPVDPGPDEPDPPDPGETEVKLEIKEGFTEVPPALRALEHLNTPEKLTRVMRTLLTQTGLPEGNTVVYDVALMVSTDGGKTWVPATAGNFPSGGLTVTLPYPEGTGPAYRFTVVHMFTTTDFGKTPGETETFGPDEVKNLEAGIQVTLTGLSPVSIGWTEPKDPPKPPDPPAPDDDDDDDDRGSGSGGGGSPSYKVVVEKVENGGGSVSASRNWASGGSAVTLTVKAEPGYRLDTLTVTDVYGREVRLTDKGGGQYGFTMPGRGDVKVKAVFAPLEERKDAVPCDSGEGCPSRSFADLVSGAWYHEAVDFVLERGLMSGYGDGFFGPDNRLSRAQFAQILYNQAGRPAGTGNGSPFTDVAPNAWCAPAAAWAAERGIAGGYGNGTFGPDDPITREQLAVMLWRYAGSPTAPGGELSFMDAEYIGAHAREAICWAVESGVMSGKSGGVLDPKGFATRAQTAQMLRNFLEQE